MLYSPPKVTIGLSPGIRDDILWSPFVDAMEMIRLGVFGYDVDPYFNVWIPIGESLVCMAVGLALCRRVRRRLIVE